jgi:hypothetical protein
MRDWIFVLCMVAVCALGLILMIPTFLLERDERRARKAQRRGD